MFASRRRATKLYLDTSGKKIFACSRFWLTSYVVLKKFDRLERAL